MGERMVRLTETTDPRAAKAQLLAAAARAPTALDPITGAIHVLRHREIERLLHEPRSAASGSRSSIGWESPAARSGTGTAR